MTFPAHHSTELLSSHGFSTFLHASQIFQFCEIDLHQTSVSTVLYINRLTYISMYTHTNLRRVFQNKMQANKMKAKLYMNESPTYAFL